MSEAPKTGLEQRLQGYVRGLQMLVRRFRDLKKRLEEEMAPPDEIEKRILDLKKQVQTRREAAGDTLLAEIAHGCAELEGNLPQRAARWRMMWLKRTAEAVTATGLNVRIEGGYVVIPPLRVGPPERKKQAVVFFGPEQVGLLPPEPRRIASWLKRWFDRLQKVLSPPDVFIDQLWSAYRRVIKGSPGERAALNAIYRELVIIRQPATFWTDATERRFRAYPRYLFSLELARLREHPEVWQDRFDIRLVTATFDATRHRRDYLWVPERGGGGGYRYAWIILQPKHSESLK